jgi:hypothetical protein
MQLPLLMTTLCCLLITLISSSPLPVISDTQTSELGIDYVLDSDAKGPFLKAKIKTKATSVTQSVSNWIKSLNTVSMFLDDALALPVRHAVIAGPSKALAFAHDEPDNVKLPKATPGIDAARLSAATTLDKIFGDVVDQLRNVASQPLNMPVAIKAVEKIYVNRLVLKAWRFEVCGWNCMNLRGADARMCFQLQRRCGDLRRS